MNLIERAIAGISPRWGAKRLYYRSVLASGKRAYDAAKRDRTTEGWNATGGSANAEIGPALDIMRKRSHDLARNNPLGASAVRKIAVNIVGKGITPSAAAADEKSREILTENWLSFITGSDPEGQTTFYGQKRLAVRTVPESGEALIRWYDRDLSEFPCPVQCEVLEPDFLDTQRTEQLSNGNVVIQGVEFDRYGRRAAYWLFDHHPGDLAFIRGTSLTSKRIEARYISHVFDRLRPGQVRGVPWFAPVAIAMRDLDDYEYAERLKKKIAACFSVFIKKRDDADPIEQGKSEDEVKGEGKTGRKLEKVQPGTVNYLRIDEEAQFASPPASEGYADYMVMQMQAIAAGLGPPYHMLTGDLRQANYSSLREGKIDFWSLVDDWQQFMVIPQICDQAWSRIHQAYARLGKGPKSWSPALWQVPRRPWVDPKSESEAEDLEFENGTKTIVEAWHERGKIPEEQYAILKKWAPLLDELGIDLFGKRKSQQRGNNGQNTNAQAA